VAQPSPAVIVFQCPASFRQSAESRKNLATFFGSIEREGKLLAWEPRGDWEPAVVRDLCQRLRLVHCTTKGPFLCGPRRFRVLTAFSVAG